MTGHEIAKHIEKAVQTLGERNQEMIKYAEKMADSEKNYRVALAKKMIELRASGTAITLIPNLARGDDIVADYRLQRDMNLAMFKAHRDATRNLSNQLTALQTLLNFEKDEYNKQPFGKR